ncbi:DUF3693 domain-containing protein [Vibrio variabilis]|nr:DUF3693 domain-containing protein [Vibrio variabilis]
MRVNVHQHKQIAHDLGISVKKLSDIRKGRAFLKENLALMIAEQIGEDQESVLIGLAADKAKTPQEQALWNSIKKKFNGLNLHSISIACVGLAMWVGSPRETIAKCVLCILC